MKGKRFLSRILVCGLSVLMVLTPSPDMVFAQNLSQGTEKVVAEVEEVSGTEEAERMYEFDKCRFFKVRFFKMHQYVLHV